jgi:valyl-tRNA synthetase
LVCQAQPPAFLEERKRRRQRTSIQHAILCIVPNKQINSTVYLITQGLAQRAAAGIKVRQPLQSVEVPNITAEFMPIIAEELNVKEVRFLTGGEENTINLDINVSGELKEEGLARELVRVVQNARKNAGFNVDDRIKMTLSSDSSEITQAAEKFKDMINSETLTVGQLRQSEHAEHSENVIVESQEVTVKLSR